MSRRANAIEDEAFRLRVEHADGTGYTTRAWATIPVARGQRTEILRQHNYAARWRGESRPAPKITIERAELVWKEVAE